MRVWLIGAGIAAVLGGGVAVLTSELLLGDEVQAHTLAPPDALAFVHATLDPSLDQKRALASLTQRLPEDGRKQLEDALPKALDTVLGEVDLDFAQDVKPWLGGEVAVFITGDPTAEPDGAALLETTDEQASLDVARRTATTGGGTASEEGYRDHTYSVVPSTSADDPPTAFTVVEGFLVVGTTGGVRSAIDASIDGGIEGNASFRELVGSLTEDRLLTYWVDTPRMVQAATDQLPQAEAEQLAGSPLLGQQQPSAGALLATADAVVLEAVSTRADQSPGLFQTAPTDPAFMSTLPADTWLSLVLPGIGPNLTSLLDSVPESAQAEQEFTAATGLDLRDDVLAWMDDGALAVTGESLQSLGGAVVIQSNDAGGTTAFVQRVADAVRQQGLALSPTSAGGLEGFELTDDLLPARVTALGGDRLVIAVDQAQAGEQGSALAGVTGGGPQLSDNAVFAGAMTSLGDGYAPIFYLEVASLVRVVRSGFGESSAPPELMQAESYLRLLSHVIAGTRDDGVRILQRVVITTSPP